MCVGLAVYILKRVSKQRAVRAASRRKLYDSSSEDSEDRRYLSKY
jgi:hypothetical protein